MENCDDDNDEASSYFPISSLLTLDEIHIYICMQMITRWVIKSLKPVFYKYRKLPTAASEF